MEPISLNELQKIIHLTFHNPEILKQALVHRSYLNEHEDFPLEHNERLEFLGDAVLELVITESLYLTYPDKDEGTLTALRSALVNANFLAQVGKTIALEEYLYLSKGESKDASSKARSIIIANAMESLIGAIYLDQGYTGAKQFVDEFVLVKLPYILEHKLYQDPKSRFQEEAQARLNVTPVYKVISEVGPDHQKVFTVGVYLGNEIIAQGVGTSKQEAQADAAQKGLDAKAW